MAPGVCARSLLPAPCGQGTITRERHCARSAPCSLPPGPSRRNERWSVMKLAVPHGVFLSSRFAPCRRLCSTWRSVSASPSKKEKKRSGAASSEKALHPRQARPARRPPSCSWLGMCVRGFHAVWCEAGGRRPRARAPWLADGRRAEQRHVRRSATPEVRRFVGFGKRGQWRATDGR